MSEVSEAPREVRVTLDRADYFELRAAVLLAESIELDALRAAQRYAAQRQQAGNRASAVFERLAGAYGFDAYATYRWDDDTYELIAAPTPAP